MVPSGARNQSVCAAASGNAHRFDGASRAVGLKAGDGGADVRTAALVDPDPPGGAVEDPLHAVASIAEIRNGAARRGGRRRARSASRMVDTAITRNGMPRTLDAFHTTVT
jgi:hypothetical protein